MNAHTAPAFTSTGDLVVASDAQHTVVVLAGATGAVAHTFGAHGAGPLQFHWPLGVCVSRDDAIFVADHNNHRIQEVPRLGRGGAATLLGVGLVQQPHSVALTPGEDGVVVRQNGGTNRVVVLARDGASILRVLLTTADMTDGYWGLAVSRSGVVAGADSEQPWLVVSSGGGEWKRTIDAAALGSPLGVHGAAFDARERLWTCDRAANCFVVMAPQ